MHKGIAVLDKPTYDKKEFYVKYWAKSYGLTSK